MPFWLAVPLEGIQIEVSDNNFLRQKVALQWLNQTSGTLTCTPVDVCNGNSPKCILACVLGFTSEGLNIMLTTEEDTRLCRLADGDLDEEDVGEIQNKTFECVATVEEGEGEVSLPRLQGVSLFGRRTTCFILR